MLRGRGRGHRRSMTPQQRAERLRDKLEWCDLPQGHMVRARVRVEARASPHPMTLTLVSPHPTLTLPQSRCGLPKGTHDRDAMGRSRTNDIVHMQCHCMCW